jgi:membrane-associated phospholipid phosphatase
MTHTWETIDMKPFTTLAIVVFTLVALVQLLRLVLGWAVAVNGVAILAWPGQPAQATNHSGVIWITPDNWLPYQKANFVTPAFPGYISGHSTFSRSAAEVLAAITGTNFFPGGLAGYTVTNLSFENGPTQPVTLQWATYFDAADQAGLSRIWGGIHPPIDNLAGRRVAAQVGKAVWALAEKYFDGSVTRISVTLALTQVGNGTSQFRLNTLRGLFYKIQSTTDLGLPFTDEPGNATLAFDTLLSATNTAAGALKFYRAACLLGP